GWVVGDSAVILRTTNGGTTWNDQNSRTDLALNSIHFVDQSAGWAVGDFGTILATTNSGLTWTMQASNTTVSLLKTKFTSRQIGWAVGYQGTIIKTTNSGATWLTQPSGTSSIINALDITDANNLYVVGDLGTILSSTTGGSTWAKQTSGFDTDLYGVAFTSPTTGWAVGEDGKIIHTNNNGSTWSLQNSGTLNLLYDVFIVKSGAIGKVFAAGVGGTILCSGISPLPVRTWTGVIDSLWNRPENWIPTGVPEKLDSVIIQQAPNSPYIQNTQQQINLSALTINTGARLRIGPLLSQLVIQSNINVNGIFQIDSNAFTQILIGKNFIVNTAGRFNPGNSSVVILGNGQIRGSFYNLKTSEDASAQSLGNIDVTNLFSPLSNFFLRPSDTLSILNPKGYAIEGEGIIGTGTIKRVIKAGSTERYQFESEATFIQFQQTGILPDTIFVTTYPNTPTPGLPSSLFVKRSYSINARGGSNYRASLSLRYEPSETIIPLEDLVLFRDSSGILSNLGKSNTLNSDYVAVIHDSIKHLSSWYLGHKNYIPKHPYEFIDSLIITDIGLSTDTVFFGVKDGATAGLDTPFGEFELSPKPPPGFFDARWIIPSTNGTQVDIRDKLNQQKIENSYLLEFQPSISGYPITFHWNNEILPIGSFFLRDRQTLGGLFNVNMRLENTKIITDTSIKSIEIIQKAPTYYVVNRGWNIVSLPLNSTTDYRKVNVFTTAISEAFGYNNSYFLAETLSTGRGYWLKYLNDHTIALEGTPVEVDTMNITTGWNMIGSITRPVAITSIVQNPPNIILGNIYSFTSGYTITDSILPAKGYWLKANGNGKLIISASSIQSTSLLKQSTSDFLSQFNSITIRDNDGSSQSLYFGTSNIPMTSVEHFELPPPPPQGILDARFRSGHFLELINDNKNQEIFIDISSHYYPLQVQTKMISPSMSVILKVDDKEIHILPASPLTILNPISHIALIISTAIGYPTKYHLDQNYPNPFNPRTIIRYQLPEDSKVVLKIYNVLGQEVKTLADEIQEMGFKETEWKGTNSSGYFLPSGVYLYRLETSSLITPGKVFTKVKKMLLIR
ncbi:MAG TPA: YCF48-related protein, partial [Bacteroidota bacterium]|nr:YCF48-related protein [Bacteroidota bacterium]